MPGNVIFCAHLALILHTIDFVFAAVSLMGYSKSYGFFCYNISIIKVKVLIFTELPIDIEPIFVEHCVSLLGNGEPYLLLLQMI
jgi:hypothetical protein